MKRKIKYVYPSLDWGEDALWHTVDSGGLQLKTDLTGDDRPDS
jgi:hypothetical protein